MSLLSKLLNFFKCDTQGAATPAPVQEVKVEQPVAEQAPAKKASKPRQPKPAAMTAAKPAPKAKPVTKSKAKASK